MDRKSVLFAGRGLYFRILQHKTLREKRVALAIFQRKNSSPIVEKQTLPPAVSFLPCHRTSGEDGGLHIRKLLPVLVWRPCAKYLLIFGL